MTERNWNAFSLEISDHIATVTLLGPGKGNAMGPDFWTECPQLFTQLDADPEVRAILLLGSGKNFTYGLDLAAMGGEFAPLMADKALAGPRTVFHDTIKRMQLAANAVADCRKPVVAAVHGWCIGGGLDLISAADIRYASADAKFSVREVKVAIVADMGSLARLPAIIGDGHLRELALTGRTSTPLAPRRSASSTTCSKVTTRCSPGTRDGGRHRCEPPLVVHGVKAVLDHTRSAAVNDSLRFVAAWNAAFLASNDLTEAITSVFEKRPADFSGS
ncbi:crotonase/enoyl-CoA hydratase family protein [Rhodococcus sp. P1Y]|uniref:crotonase/enoyl-CoA hydratase family protein n=1 Tax=Rhodococcus sp. P1Y TaxID=1302308 RepID=UPI001F2D4DBF|nr:crotonase/enoyl-CoA hydratase family protein [Rhodococcus sp. P1Y]